MKFTWTFKGYYEHWMVCIHGIKDVGLKMEIVSWIGTVMVLICRLSGIMEFGLGWDIKL